MNTEPTTTEEKLNYAGSLLANNMKTHPIVLAAKQMSTQQLYTQLENLNLSALVRVAAKGELQIRLQREDRAERRQP